MNSYDLYAERLSVNCFLNAYCREYTHWEIRAETGLLCLYLSEQTIQIGVEHYSLAGRHRFSLPIYLVDTTDSSARTSTTRTEIDFVSMAERLVTHAAGCGANHTAKDSASATASQRFLQRVVESRHNISQFMAHRKHPLSRLFQKPVSFIESEQALLAGHSVHPAPKVRQPMTMEDALAFGPEGQAGFSLRWLLVHTSRLYYGTADDISLDSRIKSLVRKDDTLNSRGIEKTGYQLLPVHPWQWRSLRQHDQLQRALQQNEIIDLGVAGSRWHATSSMRSLYQPHAPYMLKFSLSVRLTNSVRHLQPAEVERGNLICSVLDSGQGVAFSRALPQFTVMREPAYTCLVNDEGVPILESVMVFRDNPFAETEVKHQELALLATLAQDNPMGGHGRLSHMIAAISADKKLTVDAAARDWFQAFMQVALKPLIMAQANYGILMGAHQQNIVLGLDNNLPVHCYFRDCQGTGFSELGVRLHKLETLPAGINAENSLQQDMGNTLFAYYLIINSTFSVISAIAVDGLTSESTLLAMLKDFLQQLLETQPKDPSFLEYVLYSEQLYHKGNFMCSLSDLNENTLADPLSIYQPMANPIAGTEAAPKRAGVINKAG